MNWDAIGAVGELLGSVAVFVTLGYLALQVRHARSETRRALSQGRLEGNRQLIALEMAQPNLGIRVKANAGFGSAPSPLITEIMERAELTLEEARRVVMLEIAGWNYRVHVITHIDELPDIERDLFDRGMQARFRGGGVSQFIYETYLKPRAHPEIARYIENVLSRLVETGGSAV